MVRLGIILWDLTISLTSTQRVLYIVVYDVSLYESFGLRCSGACSGLERTSA